MKQAALRVLAVTGAALAVAALLAGPALLINGYENSLASGVQLVPSLWDLRAALFYLPIGAAGVMGAWLFTRGRVVLASPSRVRHFAKLILLLAFSFVTVSAAMFLIWMTSDDAIFPTEQPSASVRSPNGKRTAHLIYDCFFGCTLSYAIEEQGSWSMARTPVMSSSAQDVKLPALEWLSDEKLRFVGGDEQFGSLAGRAFPEAQ